MDAMIAKIFVIAFLVESIVLHEMAHGYWQTWSKETRSRRSYRINNAFLHDIRKQLLIWRSLDDQSKAQYEELIFNAIKELGLNR